MWWLEAPQIPDPIDEPESNPEKLQAQKDAEDVLDLAFTISGNEGTNEIMLQSLKSHVEEMSRHQVKALFTLCADYLSLGVSDINIPWYNYGNLFRVSSEWILVLRYGWEQYDIVPHSSNPSTHVETEKSRTLWPQEQFKTELRSSQIESIFTHSKNSDSLLALHTDMKEWVPIDSEISDAFLDFIQLKMIELWYDEPGTVVQIQAMEADEDYDEYFKIITNTWTFKIHTWPNANKWDIISEGEYAEIQNYENLLTDIQGLEISEPNKLLEEKIGQRLVGNWDQVQFDQKIINALWKLYLPSEDGDFSIWYQTDWRFLEYPIKWLLFITQNLENGRREIPIYTHE